jgi:gamma-glutamylcyclotransferase
MLTARLRERCPSATPAGRAFASGYLLSFDKLGRDGSGKATISPAASVDHVHGVLFHISVRDLPALDRAEWGYVRQDDFVVSPDGCLEAIQAVTYFAPQDICRSGLVPFDWYLELIRSGQREHGFSENHLEKLSDIPAVQDSDTERSMRMFSLCASDSRE